MKHRSDARLARMESQQLRSELSELRAEVMRLRSELQLSQAANMSAGLRVMVRRTGTLVSLHRGVWVLGGGGGEGLRVVVRCAFDWPAWVA